MSTTDDDNDDKCGGVSDEITSNKKECISCEQNNVDNITEGINSVAILDDKSKCASCGKEGNSNDMNICNKCKMVRYCNAACKKKHRTKHKKACERRVAELHDEALFKEVEREECPICLLPRPIGTNTAVFQSCCGKRICLGCVYAMKESEGKDLCAFCRTPPATSNKEEIIRIKKLMGQDNAGAFNMLGGHYAQGSMGMPQDWNKANELYQKAGELGNANAYYNLGDSYYSGRGVDIDKKKAKHYYELAAMNGHIMARHNLGFSEGLAGNHSRSLKHFIIAAKAGHEKALEAVKAGYMSGLGLVTKEEYANALRSALEEHHAHLLEQDLVPLLELEETDNNPHHHTNLHPLEQDSKLITKVE